METIFATLTDNQRVETLNNLYQKGLSTPKEQLAFSADKLVYLKPFISRLINADGITGDLNSRIMTRNVIDELLQDILEEIEATSVIQTSKDSAKIASEYGLQLITNKFPEEAYYTRVA